MDDNFKCIYKILTALEKSLDCERCDPDRISNEALGISTERWKKYIEMLFDSGYIKGVSIRRYTGGETVLNTKNIGITLKGLEYLSENSIMQRMYAVAKGIREFI